MKIISLCAITSILTNFLVFFFIKSFERFLEATDSFKKIQEGYCSAYPNTADDGFELFLNSSFAERNKNVGLSEWAYTWFWSMFLNIWFIGFLMGTLSVPLIADNFGRKTAIIFANSVNFVATISSVIAIFFHMPELLIIGRIMGAAGSGISMNSLILFIQVKNQEMKRDSYIWFKETTPTALRGTCSFLSEGTFIAANVIGMGFGMDVILGKNLMILIGL